MTTSTHRRLDPLGQQLAVAFLPIFNYGAAATVMNESFDCSLAGRTAVIVAAEGIQALHLRKVLTRVGIQVLDILFTVDQTLRITEDYKPDLVLLDVGTFAEDEAEIAPRVLASGACLILLSYLPEEQSHDIASEWGAHGYIAKPVGQEQIIARLKEAWSRLRQA